MRIEGLKKYRGRNPQGYFQDLPWEVKNRAFNWLHHLKQKGKRERGYVPRWLFALYVGQAKRLAVQTRDELSAWGKRMIGKRGGFAVQRLYRSQGRTGPYHPAQKAWRISVSRRKWRKRQKAEAAERERLGLPPKPRNWRMPVG